jgi:putative thioredoxin
MMTSSNIINVTEANFDFEVIEYSQNIPVLVDFWAEWSIPCKSLDPILQQLAQSGDGSFRLARINVDENPKLAMRFNVRGVPAIKAFREGAIIGEFSGLKPEDEIRRFLQHIVPSYADLILEKGNSLLQLSRWEDALDSFQQVLSERPLHPGALVGLVKSQLVLGQFEEALEILSAFPQSHEYSQAQRLAPLAVALSQNHEAEDDSIPGIERTYQHSLQLIRLSNLPAALDGLLAVLRQDKRYRQEEPRRVILGIFEILGNDNPLTRQYRNELASILF